jgi:hypothetical protein
VNVFTDFVPEFTNIILFEVKVKGKNSRIKGTFSAYCVMGMTSEAIFGCSVLDIGVRF